MLQPGLMGLAFLSGWSCAVPESRSALLGLPNLPWGVLEHPQGRFRLLGSVVVVPWLQVPSAYLVNPKKSQFR